MLQIQQVKEKTMRAVTREEIDRIAGGLKHIYRKTGLRPESSGTCPNGNCPPVTVTPPPSSGGGIPSGGGGGGGPVRVAPPPSGGGGVNPNPTNNPLKGYYFDGTHTIDPFDYTEKYTPGNTHYTEHNPGNLALASWEAKFGATTSVNGFAAFSTEQGGANAMGALLDGHYGGDTMTTFVTDGYNNGPGQGAEQSNIVLYMEYNGYPSVSIGTPTKIDNLSDAEFNTFLRAVANAEGETNM
jgi:hypothetical protein